MRTCINPKENLINMERSGMDYESVGRFNTEKAKKILKLLREQVPHIHWELGWGDGHILDVMKYANICVPEFQHDEAEYIITLLENGEDLSDYQSDSRFPILFEKENGVFHVVKPLTCLQKCSGFNYNT